MLCDNCDRDSLCVTYMDLSLMPVALCCTCRGGQECQDCEWKRREAEERRHAMAPDRERRAELTRSYVKELRDSIRMVQFRRGTAR